MSAYRKKGLRFGENHHGATLTDDEVDHIRRLHETDGLAYQAIADLMEIPKSTVAGICQYRRRGIRSAGCA